MRIQVRTHGFEVLRLTSVSNYEGSSKEAYRRTVEAGETVGGSPVDGEGGGGGDRSCQISVSPAVGGVLYRQTVNFCRSCVGLRWLAQETTRFILVRASEE
jgi:hypothetical protein